MVSVQDRLEQARYAVGRGISQRRACTLLSVARSGLDYQCKMAVKDQPIVAAMRQYSEQYPRYGARRICSIPRQADIPKVLFSACAR